MLGSSYWYIETIFLTAAWVGFFLIWVFGLITLLVTTKNLLMKKKAAATKPPESEQGWPTRLRQRGMRKNPSPTR